MAEIVRMPKLSDTMEEGVVAEWHKKVGDKVESGDLLAEIETDKATMEFESFQDGVLIHIGVEKGDAAPVDSILAILGEKGEDISDLLEGEGDTGSKEKKSEKADKEESADEDKEEEEQDKEAEEQEKENKKESKQEDKSSDAEKMRILKKTKSLKRKTKSALKLQLDQILTVELLPRH